MSIHEFTISGKQVYATGSRWTYFTPGGKPKLACVYCIFNSNRVRLAKYKATTDNSAMCERCSYTVPKVAIDYAVEFSAAEK